MWPWSVNDLKDCGQGVSLISILRLVIELEGRVKSYILPILKKGNVTSNSFVSGRGEEADGSSGSSAIPCAVIPLLLFWSFEASRVIC